MTADRAPPADLPDGLHFGVPDETYHAIPALSASGIKNLLISPTDWWFNSWMNPLKEDDEDSEARIVGRAYHTRILEGSDAFARLYCEPFNPPPEALKTIEDMRDALEAVGVKSPSKWKRSDYVDAVRAELPDAVLFDDIKADWDAANAGKTALGGKTVRRIEIAAAMIERHPHLSKCFRGGYPEVTVIWTEDGIRFKARFDYLKPRAVVDLKSFANLMNKPIDAALYSAMASGKYHLQFAFYMDRAVLRARDFVRAGAVTGTVDADWLKQFAATEEFSFYAVFQKKGNAPLARGKKFERGLVHGAAVAAIEEAITRYRDCLARFGTDPWIDDAEIDSFEDSHFPPWTCEI